MGGIADLEIVPAHMGDLEGCRIGAGGRIDGGDLGVDPAKALVIAVFMAGFRHQLHADTNA